MRKRSFATWAFSLGVIAISRIPFLSPSMAIPSSLYIRFNRVISLKSISKGERKYNMEKAGINHWPEEERPRERLIREGADRLSPAQLLAIGLPTGSGGERRGVLSRKDVYDVSRHYIQYFHGLKKEVFRLLMLDGKNRIFADYTVSEGCLTSSIVHPREVYIQAIRNSAASVIFLHNHPSGDPSPSPEDVDITKRLVAAGERVGIKVLDHIIMGEKEDVSFADKGLL